MKSHVNLKKLRSLYIYIFAYLKGGKIHLRPHVLLGVNYPINFQFQLYLKTIDIVTQQVYRKHRKWIWISNEHVRCYSGEDKLHE